MDYQIRLSKVSHSLHGPLAMFQSSTSGFKLRAEIFGGKKTACQACEKAMMLSTVTRLVNPALVNFEKLFLLQVTSNHP